MGMKARPMPAVADALWLMVRCVYCRATKTIRSPQGGSSGSLGVDDLPLCSHDGGLMLVYGAVREPGGAR